MVAESIWGVDSALLYSVMSVLWVLLLVGLYYRRNHLSQRRFSVIFGMGLVWLVYSLFNVNHVVLTAVPTALTIGIDVVLVIAFLAGCYISIKALTANAE